VVTLAPHGARGLELLAWHEARGLLNAGSLVLLLGAQQIARGASIVAVRLWPAPDYTRLTIESDGLLASKQVVSRTSRRGWRWTSKAST
jgi:hypothetical protein